MCRLSESSTSQVAQQKGIYRCTRLGETHFSEIGEHLPACSCEGGGSWLFFKEDNLAEKDAIPVFIGQGAIHATVMDEIPEIGYELNIMQATTTTDIGIVTGRDQVTNLQDDFRWGGKSHFRIDVKRIGDLTDDLPIHRTGLMTC